MSHLTLGRRLKIRSMIHMAAESIPNFWPMRTFIHHNPLHGLEHLDFETAVRQGEQLFHGRGFLSRGEYQRYDAEGRVCEASLKASIADFLAKTHSPNLTGLDLPALLLHLLKKHAVPVSHSLRIATTEDVAQKLAEPYGQIDHPTDIASLATSLHRQFPPERPLYEAIDRLFGTQIGETIDELLIKSLLDFFDEGQSTWQMPHREKGLFWAWSAIAKRNVRFFLRGVHICKIIRRDATPEGTIDHILSELGLPEAHWPSFITRELTRLHGWAGFIRWRSSSKNYHWAKEYPADLIDLLAIRLVVGLALIREESRRHKVPATLPALRTYIDEHTAECYLRQAYHSGTVLPAYAHAVDDALAHRHPKHINRILPDYLRAERNRKAGAQAEALLSLCRAAGQEAALRALDADSLGALLGLLAEFEHAEGMFWLRAMEAVYRRELLAQLRLNAPHKKPRRPFAQALFCIDVRSEPIRRQLETVGEYQTFGIAGFFGVPVSFIGLGKGSESHLCPVVITPKNLVLEVPTGAMGIESDFYSSAGHVLHELKSSVLSPYFTVEAIGLLFGFDMIGKTIAPRAYHQWRNRIEPKHPSTRLLIDKLTREDADSIVRALQRVMIVRAVRQDFGIERESVTDAMVKELRETAMGLRSGQTEFARHFALSGLAEEEFIARLQTDYQINRSYVSMQMERLGRIGFSVEEQAYYVEKALQSIGLTENFSRFILLVGHLSQSENNPYESALDCGACGGGQGLASARVLAQMGNKPEVRRKLREQGIDIPDDAWFLPTIHNTTSDALELHELDLLPNSHLVYLERLRNGLRAASRLNAAERLPKLEPHTPRQIGTIKALKRIERNASDWTQVRPEWGLARNAAVIVGGRHLTEGVHLDGRTFLQSYDYRVDPKGRLLESILTGPLIVGQWINMEHYFSAVDNERFGSGSKAYHNVAGRFGVITGNLSDLRTGLPAQSVLRDGRPYHEPIRLLAIIEAPIGFVGAVVGGLPKIKSLVVNGWVTAVIADPESGHLHHFDQGSWHDLGLAPFLATKPAPAVT